MKQHTRPYTWVLIFSLVLFGCSDWFVRESAVVEQQQDYHQRILNLLDVAADTDLAEQVNSRFNFPERRTLSKELQEISVNWSDFFSTISCPELQQLISERNSQVGRQAGSINSLIYELRFARLIQSCKLEDEEFSDEWRQALELKRRQFFDAAWNYSWASQIWQGLFYVGGSPVSSDTQEAVITSMAKLRKSIDQKNVERSIYQIFATLELSKGAMGQLIMDGAKLVASLEYLNRALSEHTQVLCPQNQPTQKAEYLVNVLRKFFLQKAQHKIRDVLNMLRKSEQEVLYWKSMFDQQWVEQLDSIIFSDANKTLRSEQLARSLQQHIKVWERVGKQCGIKIHQNTAQ